MAKIIILLIASIVGCESSDITIVYDLEYLSEIEKELNGNNINYELNGNTFKYSGKDSESIKSIIREVRSRVVKIEIYNKEVATALMKYWDEDLVRYKEFLSNDGVYVFLINKADCEESLRGLVIIGIGTKRMCN